MTNSTRTIRTDRTRALLFGAAGLLAGVIIASGFGWTACSRAESPAVRMAAASLPLPTDGKSPFVAVAKKVAPAVVNIRSKKLVDAPGLQHFGPFDDFFRDFFGEQPRQQAPRQQRVQEGQGSGFIIDRQGLILTNNHVVAGGGELTVTLSDQREFTAEVVGTDPRTDVAVIRIKDLKHDLPQAEVALLGNSDEVEVGDYAIAIGNPFGLERTVTQGIISYKGRSGLPIGGGPMYQDFIQTDAAINYGNSGGPLVNIRGEVIGINTAINPAGQGIGFAIPINMAGRVKDQLVDKGRVVRGYLGVVPQEITADMAEGLGIKSAQGVIVARVQDGTPAEQAGLQTGDVIVAIDGRAVKSVKDFRQMVADAAVGAKVKLTLLRDAKEKVVAATLAELPDESAAKPSPQAGDKPWLGIRRIIAASSDEARRMGVTDQAGVVLLDIESGSPADDAGLRQGDLVKKIAGRDIRTPDDYHKAAKGLAKAAKPVLFLVKRQDQGGDYALFVVVKPGK
ncbi:MAG: Do family serine endopeptidase [Candidatus Edwardsbacteria bacterium]|jgi:serine protease Do|nr:Do family serine endopeptidase [Candidatus Edwardsbacteria bacterium]